MAFETNGVKFYLFTSEEGKKLKSIKNDKYDINPNYPVKIVCHGWMDDKKSYWYKPIVSAYLKKGGVNLIAVDWGKYAKGLFSRALKSVRMVGSIVAMLIRQISEQYHIPYACFHVIGHSLGSHIAGFAGKNIIEESNQKIGRITGLDPAGPGYKEKSSNERLCADDAMFVDIIHTDGGGLGLLDHIGHADFYPNGGKKKQPGCGCIDGGCSHKRAPLYFTESVNTNCFVGAACESYEIFLKGKREKCVVAVMGENCDWDSRGKFYLKTNSATPFAVGKV